MSGHKKATITISQKEYQRLHKNELRMRFMHEPVPENLKTLEYHAQDAYQKELQNLETRQRNFENIISGFEAHIRNLETETNGVLIDHQTGLSEFILLAAEQNWNKTQQALQSQEARTNALLHDLTSNFEGQIALLTDQYNSENVNRKTRADKVRQWIVQTIQMLQFIQGNYDHEKFAPGQVEAQIQPLQLAQDNFENGFLETSLAASQQVYFALSNLRLQLESQQHHYNILLEVAGQNIEKLYLLANENRFLPGVDLDGNEMDTQLDIDYWSSRKLSRLINEIQGQAHALENNQQTLNNQILTHLIEIEIPRLEQQLEDIIYRARLNALNSQLRINIADFVLQALETQGYRIEDAQYLNKDMRQEYQVMVKNMEGNQVLVQVIPNQDYENELQMHSMNQTARTRHELQQQTREIGKALNYFGLSMGPITEIDPIHPNTQTSRNGRQRRINPQIKDITWKQTHAL